MGNRTWIKVHCDKWIEGTIREESPLVRSVFIDLIALAGSGMYGDKGEIKLQNDVGLTDKQLRLILHLTKQQWVAARNKLLKTERIAIDTDGVISICNWGKYQSEYERQKTYRSNQKLQVEVTGKSYIGERERDIREREREREISQDSINKKNTESFIDDPDKYIKGKYGHMVQR